MDKKEKVKKVLFAPFVEKVSMLLLLWVLLSAAPLIFYMRLESYIYCVYMLSLTYILSAVITWTIDYDTLIFKCIKTVVLSVLFLLNTAYVIGQVSFGLLSPVDSLAFIAQTNAQEAQEFLSSNVSLGAVCAILAVIVSFVSFLWLYVWRGKRLKVPRYMSVACGALFVVSMLATSRNLSVLDSFIACNNFSTVIENSVDLRDHLTHPDVAESCKDHPSSVVVIIGESFSKYHSSLYGYGKETNPCLEEYVRSGNIVVFDSVESPCTSTTPNFKYILNTHRRGDNGRWYESTTIQEVYKTVGYHTCWISNQQEFGVYNNISSGQSLLCDEKFFHGGEGQSLDMCVYETFRRMRISGSRNLIFFHLFGQHPEFCKRYPAEFSKFKLTDYKSRLESQRENMASYDNATLYNDKVVSNLISCFEDKDALVFYFSDHGLDLYYTDDSYCAHGRPNDKESDRLGRQIPFVVYVSDKYKRLHPNLYKQICEVSHEAFCSESFIDYLMQFSGFELKKKIGQ